MAQVGRAIQPPESCGALTVKAVNLMETGQTRSALNP